MSGYKRAKFKVAGKVTGKYVKAEKAPKAAPKKEKKEKTDA